MAKIFCIGLNKTGTNSLHRALIQLGYKSLHWGGFASEGLVDRAIAENRPLLYYFKEDFDAYSDLIELTLNFDVADQQYPGSKFILTWRDLDSWLDSRTRHVKRNQFNQERGLYPGKWTTIDHQAWIELWHSHQEKVTRYFAERKDDLLVMNICAGQGYELLCPFLNKPVPAEPFPWRNPGK